MNPVYVSIVALGNVAEGGTTAFRVSRTGGLDIDVTVNFTVAGTAKSGTGEDYEKLTGTVTIGAGSYDADIEVVALRDNRLEDPETVEVTLGTGTNYLPDETGKLASLNINDDPARVAIGPTTQNVDEGWQGGITLSRSGGDVNQPLTARFTVGANADPLAIYVDDYTLTEPTLVDLGGGLFEVTFPATFTAVYVGVPAVADGLEEVIEGFRATVVANGSIYVPGSETGGQTTADARVIDGTAVVTVSAAGDPSEKLPTPGSFTFTRTGGNSNRQLAVNYSVVAGIGAATTGVDYEFLTGTTATDPLNGTITFDVGVTSVTIPLTVKKDKYIEDPESVQVQLGNGLPQYVVGQPATASRTIQEWVDLTTYSIGGQETVSTDLKRLGEFTDLSDAANLDYVTATIHWGDGQLTEGVLFSVADGSDVSHIAGRHTYGVAGVYQIQVGLYFKGVLVGSGLTQASVSAYQPPEQLGYHPNNFVPIAADDYYLGSFAEGFPYYATAPGNSIEGVLTNDVDIDYELSVTAWTNGQYGLVQMSPDGSFEYTPGLNFPGDDSFTYTVSDGAVQTQATVWLKSLPQGVPPLGNNTLIADSSIPTPNLPTLPQNLDVLQLAKALQRFKLSEYLDTARKKLVDGLLGGLLADKVFALSQDTALWTDFQGGSVNGGLMFGPRLLDKTPFGLISYESSEFSAKINIPEFDAQGQLSKVNTLTLDKNGLTGRLSVGRGSWIDFQNGIAGAQVTDGDYIYGFDRASKSLTTQFVDPISGATKTVLRLKKDQATLTLGDLSVTIGPKVFSFSSPELGDFTIELNNDNTIKLLKTSLKLGGDRSLAISYSNDLLTRSLTATLNTGTVNFAFTYAPNVYSFTGSFSFDVFDKAPPVNGFVTVTRDAQTRTTNFSFGIAGTW